MKSTGKFLDYVFGFINKNKGFADKHSLKPVYEFTAHNVIAFYSLATYLALV